jgi:hypothetical protein
MASGGGGGGAAMLDEDWEEWTPEKGSFLHHMLAGSVAGVAEHVSIFPIDTIKVSTTCRVLLPRSRLTRRRWWWWRRRTCSASGAL